MERLIAILDYLFRKKTKEVLVFIILGLIITLLSLMVSYDPKTGWHLEPAAEVKIEVKK